MGNVALSEADGAALDALVREIEAAWNDGDATRFAARFAEDADFVIILGERHSGRPVIEAGHAGIFRTIYKDSRLHYTIEQRRALAEGVALVHLEGRLEVPQGPLAGTIMARLTMVAVRAADGWEIASMQTTEQRAPGPGRP